MTVVADKQGDLLILTVSGKLDIDLSPRVEEVLFGAIGRGEKRIVVDLSEVPYISSRGLRVFLVGLGRAKDAGTRLVTCGLTEFVAEVFRISGFEDLMEVFASLDDARASLAES